jgi:2-keto-4-pentenoate hydratase/2-oxohepta-3-ene-1,7-dioic acid hydratase in catechol pathway
MRIANIQGRAAILTGEGRAVDVESASEGRFGPDLPSVYDHWGSFRPWAASAILDGGTAFDEADLGAPSPAPRQSFGVGLNYAAHAAESGLDTPTGLPPIFPKFVSAYSGPVTTVVLPEGGNTDWEIEVVAIIGATAHNIDEAAGWDYIAGLAVGQDISERVIQLSGPAPQFGLGKSYPGFAPSGPWLVTPDELDDPDDLSLECTLDGEVMQHGRTANLTVPIPRLVSEMSRIVTLYPGDVIFTGTPEGVGLGRDPKRFIQPGQTLVSTVDGIGELRQTFVKA